MATFSKAAARPLRGSLAAQATRAASTAASGHQQEQQGQFFPIESSPFGPVRPTVKPPSQEWYTARPSLTQTLAHLEHAVTQSRAHLFRQGLLRSISQSIAAGDAEFAAVLPHPRQRRWKPAKDMAAYLRTGAQLKSSQYKRLTATLAHLEGLLPYARVADSLTVDGAVEASTTPPALVVDPVALATGRAGGNPSSSSSSASSSPSSSSSLDATRGQPAHGLAAQLEQLLSRFQQPAAVSSTGVTVERISGQARRLGAQDAQQRVLAVGRRKESGARVWIVPASAAGDAPAPAGADSAETPLGRVLVNTLPLPTYFSQLPHREAVVRPLTLVSGLGAFNVFAIVKGGGQAAQADAVAMGLARALAEWERIEVEAGRREPGVVSWRDVLKRATLIERDPRVVERKKTGRVKARKMPTWVKR